MTIPANAGPTESSVIKFVSWLAAINPIGAYAIYFILVGIAVVTLFWHPEKGWDWYRKKSLPVKSSPTPTVTAQPITHTTPPPLIVADVVPPPKPIPVNWSIWRLRSEYTINDFASILAKVDPASEVFNSEKHAYSDLILDDIINKKIDYIPRFSEGADKTEHSVNKKFTRLKKAVAIEWATARSLDVNHVK